MTTFEDLVRPPGVTPRAGNGTPRHRHRHNRPTLAELAAAVGRAYRDSIPEGLRAALARDIPTSTPSGTADFQRIWRASW